MTGNGTEKGRNVGHGVVPPPFICPRQAWSEITPSFPPTSFDFKVPHPPKTVVWQLLQTEKSC